MSDATLAARLESYTLKYPQEVLLVHAESHQAVDQTSLPDVDLPDAGPQPDQILVFRGFSSSLVRPTAFDPEVPVLSDTATIVSIDRLQGPYQPLSPDYIERHISLDDFIARLVALGL